MWWADLPLPIADTFASARASRKVTVNAGPSRTLLSINNYYYPRGGAEVVFLEQNRMLEEAGWRVVPFSMRHPKNLPSPWSRYFVDELELGGSYSALGKVKRASKVIYSREARSKLSLLLGRVRPHVAHLHNIYHHISPSILGLLSSHGIPMVMTLHDLKLVCPAYKMMAPDGVCERCRGGRLRNVVRHRCIKGSLALSTLVYVEAKVHTLMGTYAANVDRFVVPSRFFGEKLASWGIAKKQLHYLPNFVDVSRYRPAEAAGDHFLYFGRLAPEKGVATLIRAGHAAGVPVRIVGTGPEEANLRRLAGELGGSVEFFGYLTGEALHEAVRQARAVVLPSEWYENAPMSVLEAYALGVPVIGADIGGIPELIREGETGACYPSGNVEALAEVLTRFQRLPDADVRAMGRAAGELVRSEFSSTLYSERLLALYRELRVPC
jgi:glycosyltransferase involved in cell wall biosynthesis